MMRRGRRLAPLLVLALTSNALADDPRACPIVDFALQPAVTGDPLVDRYAPQIVAWVEDASGTFVDTVYITQATGTFGIGNRPGRFDFNSAPFWPYGRRITTFPVWADRQPLRWQQLGFQDDDDNDLSHSGAKSSRDQHFCRPLRNPGEMDALSCPTSISFTDKGTFGSAVSKYPRRDRYRRAGRRFGRLVQHAEPVRRGVATDAAARGHRDGDVGRAAVAARQLRAVGRGVEGVRHERDLQ